MIAEYPQSAWVLARAESEFARELARDVGVSALTAQLMLNRGIREADDARKFLRPAMTNLADPSEIAGMGAAAERVARAVRDREKVVVYGDYDVDGISSTALFSTFLNLLGANATGYLPNRFDEGYGLNTGAVQRIAESGTKLLVTVDHGTTAIEEITLARELGLDVIVIDHHTPAEELPPANAVVNPHLSGTPGLCGVGVTFKVAWAVARELSGSPRVAAAHREFLTDALALVALGTVADVVPLQGENRILTHFGLARLMTSKSPGIRALFTVSGLGSDRPTASDIGFKLAPRINAAGRLGQADLALELLLTKDTSRATEIANLLDKENNRRRKIELSIFEMAVRDVEEKYGAGHLGAIALGDEKWHAGVIGIVASRLVTKYRLPTALAAFDGGLGRGSCRSIPALALPDALADCAQHLVSWGGHAAAAGFTIRAENFEAFQEDFNQAVAKRLRPEDQVRPVRIDATARLDEISPAFIRELERIGPFGEGNREPVFATRGLRVAGQVRRMGKTGDHVSFLASDGERTFRAVGFRMGALVNQLAEAPTVDLAYTPRFDDWRKDGSIELRLKDAMAGNGRTGD